MRLAISDTGPPQYLVLFGAIDCLPELFGRVLIPEAVAIELSHPRTPTVVRAWLDSSPPWIERRPASGAPDELGARGAGERAAIGLACSVGARMLLIDDRAGEAVARTQGLETVGTLGVLIRTAQLGMIDLEKAFAALRATNFRCRPELLDALLAQHG